MSDTALVALRPRDDRRFVVAAVAVALLALLVASRPAGFSGGHSSPSAEQRAEAAGIDVDGVADRLAHQLASTGDGTFTTGDAQYRASFDRTGFTMSPTGADDGGHLRIALDAPAAGPWRSDGNVASRSAGDGLTERVTATHGAVEWDVVLARRPAGTGALRLAAEIDGVASARVEGNHWVLALDGGNQLNLDELVVKDATGTVLHRALPSIDDGRLMMVIPASVLDSARYPLTVDPTVSAEHDVGAVAAEGAQTAPAVAWNGTEFLVVWLDDRVEGHGLYAARVTPGGGIIDADGIPIDTGHFSVGRPAVTSNGSDFLVVWSDARNGDHSKSDIFGTRISSAGVPLDVLSINISTDGPDETFPVVAWNGTNYLVVWDEGRIVATRVNSAGTVIDAKQFPISDANGSQDFPAVTSDGTNWFVVWQDGRNGNSDVYGTRIANDHTILDGVGFPIATGTDPQTNPSVAYNGTLFLVGWQRQDIAQNTNVIEARRVNTSGVLQGTAATPLSSSILELEPAVGNRGSTFIVTWEELRLETSSFDIRGRRISSNGSLPETDSFPIGDSTTHETLPAIANGASSTLTVWQDQRSTVDIRGARVDANAGILDPNGITISTGPTPDFQWSPAIAWNGTVFLVVWEDGRSGTNEDIYGARVDQNGVVLDPGGIPISTAADGQYTPAVASNGSAFLVAWEDFRNGADYDIYGTRVSGAGAVLNPAGIAISTAADDQTSVSVGWNGGAFVTAWQDLRSHTTFDIYGSRVSAAGAVLDPTGKAFSTSAGSQQQPSVASTNGTTLVVWSDNRTGTPDIRGTRVNTTGTALDTTGIAISTATGSQVDPSVAWTDGTYLAVWSDTRNGASNADIYGARLNNAGVVQDATGFAVSTATGPQDEPAVAFNGTFLVVYRDGRNNSTYDVYATQIKTDGTRSGADFAVSASGFNEFSPAVSSGPGAKWGITYSRSQVDSGQGTYFRTVAPK